ncbi:MAG: hypothetical protein ACE5HS_00160 [bacterium]
MKSFSLFMVALLFPLLAQETEQVFAKDWIFGIGLNSGVSRLEGDIHNPNLSPIISGHLRVLPIPYLAINGELGYSALSSDTGPNLNISNFKTTIIPFELSVIFNFIPLKKVNPYVFIGGGGVYWKATGSTIPSNKFTLDSFLKTGGGLEFNLSKKFSVNVGASFRYSLTDVFDSIPFGDENDQVLDAHAGITYYFRKNKNDRDNDFISDDIDLMPEIAEDKDGYLDHDGIPEKNPSPENLANLDLTTVNNHDASPILIHDLITKAESGSDIPIKAFVYSGIELRVVAALYRPIGTPNWNVVRLTDEGGNLYQGSIPGYAVTTEGIEYCVIAVDETLSGIGYSGLPSKPITMRVSPSGKPWRILGGVIGAASVGTASYLVLRSQN